MTPENLSSPQKKNERGVTTGLLLTKQLLQNMTVWKHDFQVYLYTITAITEHLKFTTFKVKNNNIVTNANIVRYRWYQICPSFTVRDEKIHPWTNKERKSFFWKMILLLHYWQSSTSSQYGNDPGPRVFQETHLGKPYLFQHWYAQKTTISLQMYC